MRRRNAKKPQVGVSLFPFLAVLICTMGSLIVLLLLLVQQARVDASTRSRASDLPAPRPQVDTTLLTQQIEEADWRREILTQQREQKTQELADQRLALAHLEDHIRRLEQRWKELEAQAAQLAGKDESRNLQRENVQQQLAQAQAEIEAARQQLADARAAAGAKPRSYSLIPYDGPNGTRRRPVYIECTADFVIIQPEGVRLEARDFEGPLGPGNPLDASLRAVREYLARNPELVKQGEPYPLLVVRPSGVLSYAAARSAMKSWDDEFGYELIEDETKLAYPQADPTLAAMLQQAIAEARRRQQLLAQAAPSRFRGTSAAAGGGSPHGGFRSVVPVEDYHDEMQSGGGPDAGIGRGGGGAYNEQYQGSQTSRSGGDAASGQAQQSRSQGGDRHQDAAANEAQGTGTAAEGAAAPPPDAQHAQPLANRKGANWALPNFSDRSTAITRPIRIRVEDDRYMILPERGERRAARVVPLTRSAAAASEELVQQINQEVESWGIAVANGYWRPVLNIEVAPGSDERFAELQMLLDGSGLEIRRRSP
jgi:hypothetical protein